MGSTRLFTVLVLGLVVVGCTAGNSELADAANGDEASVSAPTTEAAIQPTVTAVPTETPTAIPLPDPTATAAPSLTPSPVPSDVMLDINELEDISLIFDQHQGEVRLLLFLATGCPSCLAGARWLEEAVLTQDPEMDVTIFAIWQQTVPGNMLPTALSGPRDESVLNDPRVIHFWDRRRLAGSFFAQNMQLEGPERSSLNNVYGGAVWGRTIWDVYLLLDREASWDDFADHVIESGVPILNHRDQLRAALNPDLPVIGTSIDGATTYQIIPAESFVSYGVAETFAERSFNYAIGITSEVSGEMLIDPANPAASQIGPVTIGIDTFQSDNFLRDQRIQTEFLESAMYPLAVFTPTELRSLPNSYTPGDMLTFEVAGELNVRETAVPTVFTVTAQLENGRLSGTAVARVLMTDFGFDPPAIAGFIAAENEVDITFEFVAEPVADQVLESGEN